MERKPLLIGLAAGVLLAAGAAAAFWWWRNHHAPDAGTPHAPVPAEPLQPDPPEAVPQASPVARVRTHAGPKASFAGFQGIDADTEDAREVASWLDYALATLPDAMRDAGAPLETRDVFRFHVVQEPDPPGEWAPFLLQGSEDGTWDITLSMRALMLGAVDPAEAVRAAAMTAWFRERLDGAELDMLTAGLALQQAGLAEAWLKRGILDAGIASRSWSHAAMARAPYGRFVLPLALCRAAWEPLGDAARGAALMRLRDGESPWSDPAVNRGMDVPALTAALQPDAVAIILSEDRDARENYRRARELEGAGKVRQAHALYTDLLARWPDACIAGDAGIRRAILMHRLGLSHDAAFMLIPAASGEAGAHARDTLIADGMLAMADIRFREGLTPISHDLRDRLEAYALTEDDRNRARMVANHLAETGYEGALEPQFEPAEPIAPVRGGAGDDREEDHPDD